MLVRIASNPSYAGEGGDFLGGTLSVATCYQNFGLGILTADASQGSAGLLIGGGCDRAGIQNNVVGGCWRTRIESPGRQLAVNGGAVGLACATAKIFNVEARHPTLIVAKRGRAWVAIASSSGQTAAATLVCWKHSRHRTGLPWLGRNGTVVSLLH